MARSRLFKQSFMAPVGQTEKSAGAGGAIPHASAPGVQPAQDSPVDLSKLGGLLYFMGQKPKVDHMTLDYQPADAETVEAGMADMTPEQREGMAATARAMGREIRPDFGTNRARYWDASGNEVFPEDNIFQRMGRSIGRWFS